jgi:sarcosine oxidase gamma subunit
MKTLQAGPAGVFHPGQTRVVGPDEYAVLVPEFADDADEAFAADEAPAAEKSHGKGKK